MTRFLPWLLLVPLVAAAEETTNRLNGADIYWPAMSNISAWVASDENRSDQLRNGDIGFAGARETYTTITDRLAPMREAGRADHCDWGTQYEKGFAALLPHVGLAMTACRASVWAARYAWSNNLPGAVDHLMTGLRLARDVGGEPLLINLLVQSAAERKALECLRDNLDHLDARGLADVRQSLAALPPGGNLADALKMEKAMGIDLLIGQLTQAIRAADTNLFIIEEEPGAAGAGETNRAAQAARNSSLTRDLRLSSIMMLPDDEIRLGFETRGGDSFVVTKAVPDQGVHVIRADFEKGEAVITRSNETALVKLESREIAPARLRLRRDKDGLPNVGTNTLLLGLIQLLQEARGEASKANPMASDRPVELLAELQRASREFDEVAKALNDEPVEKYKAWETEFLKRASPFTRIVVPSFAKAREKLVELEMLRDDVEDAIEARRAALAK